MKRTLSLLAWLLLAAGLAVAQDTTSNGANGSQNPRSDNAAGVAQYQNPDVTTKSSSTTQTVIRGCLSGSSGNYTLTDQNGMQYQISGDDATLASMVGREVELTGTESQASEAGNQGDETTHAANAMQASEVRAVSQTCNQSGSVSAPPPVDNNGTNPKGTPESNEPPKPELMSMLQQQNTPDDGTQQQKGTARNPPVTSQTPAAPQSPTAGTAQAGKSPANETGMTESEANRDAQAARQSEINTNPQTGKESGRGVDNQGVNNPSQTKPNAVPQSRHDTKPPSSEPASTPPESNPDKQ